MIVSITEHDATAIGPILKETYPGDSFALEYKNCCTAIVNCDV